MLNFIWDLRPGRRLRRVAAFAATEVTVRAAAGARAGARPGGCDWRAGEGTRWAAQPSVFVRGKIDKSNHWVERLVPAGQQ